jgi:hypothetical protein
MGKISNAIEKAGLDGNIIVQNFRPLTERMVPNPNRYRIAAHIITKGPTMLVWLSDLALSNQATNTKFFQYYSILNKMQLIGTNEIKQTISAFVQELISTYLMLLFERCRLLIRQGNIDLLSTFITKSKSKEEFHLRSFFRLAPNNYKENKNREAILNDLKLEIEQQKTYFNEQQKLISIQNRELFHYTKLCIVKAKKLSQLIPHGFTGLSCMTGDEF